MIYTKLTKKAILLAYNKHSGQIDKGGLLYILHPLHVAEKMDDEDSTIVALLHDVLEDTDTTLEELKKYGFSDASLNALKILNHDKSVDYYEYIKIVATNELSKKVKLADLKHNSDLTRLENISEKDTQRVLKYKKCIDYLEKYNNIKLSK